MTNTKKDNKNSSEDWFVVLLNNLSLKDQTKAQTANHVADGMATIMALAYVVSKPPAYYSFALIIIVLGFILTCFIVSKPPQRKK